MASSAAIWRAMARVCASSSGVWISPRAGESLDYRDRNFSCRDDHTRLFDRITLPGLSADEFVRCDYDAFHSVVHFREQRLHAVSLFDRFGTDCLRPIFTRVHI